MDGKYHYFALRAGTIKLPAVAIRIQRRDAGCIWLAEWCTRFVGRRAARCCCRTCTHTCARPAVAAATPAPSQPVAKIAKSAVAAPVAAPVPPPAAAKSGGIPWGCLIPLLLVLLLAALFFLFRGCESEKPVATPPPRPKLHRPPTTGSTGKNRTRSRNTRTGKTGTARTDRCVIGICGRFSGRHVGKLSQRSGQHVPENVPVGKPEFRNRSGSARTAKAILDKVAKVLEAYPSVKFRIDGHNG
ncbi:MAG: hypothetical protein R3C26_02535 [Calditrichia bacterium]